MKKTPARRYAKGIGDAVADRTINRKKLNGKRETWADVAERVSEGSALLHPVKEGQAAEFHRMNHHLRQASLLMSGRHLQHGDDTQPERNQELFTNCSTSASTFLTFYLLLNGSGVGRAYDDKMMVVDWRNQPIVAPVIDMMHPDAGEIKVMDARTARHVYAGRKITEFVVPDSREGWAQALELLEVMTYEGNKRGEVLLLDFSKVRCKGSPICGMQNRPASGPAPLMSAIKNIAGLRDAGMAPWRAALFADHYVAECVLVGGARRAARMATKFWKDKSVLDFIEVKRGGFLWSSNNSVTVDREFWEAVKAIEKFVKNANLNLEPEAMDKELEKMVEAGRLSKTGLHAYRVFNALAYASYHDQTGEPGIINVDRLTWKDEGIGVITDGDFAGSQRYKVEERTQKLQVALAKAWMDCQYKVITNPCGEIVLGALGGYCVIADVVPFHAGHGNSKDGEYSSTDPEKRDVTRWDMDAEDAFRTATRALIRTNLMDALYSKEVKRTNRIGVGITGLHEYAWARFGLGWKDLIDEQKSIEFWKTLSRFSNAVVDEAHKYSAELGVVVPHTMTTMKPAGCASLDTAIKTTEGAVTMREFFTSQGYAEAEIAAMANGTWLEPKRQSFVLDKDNVEREVTKLYVNGVQPVFEIAFENGTVAKLTGNHKLMTKDGWKRVDELTEEDEIVHF